MLLFNRIKYLCEAALILLNLHSVFALSWLDEYTLVDLELNGADFVNEATGWTMASCPGNGCVNYYDCDGTYLVGGNLIGNNLGDYFERIYTDLPNHNQINMKITLYPIDSWDGDNYGDHFDFQLDGTNYTGWTLDVVRDFSVYKCGNSSYKDLPPIRATLTIPHAASSITFRVVSQLNQGPFDESLGFRDIVMNFVNVSTPSFSLCGVVTAGNLPDKICPCEETNMYMSPANSGNCHYCDDTCLTCAGPDANQCLTCDPYYYLIADGTCRSCDGTCLTCNGALANECLTCADNYYFTPDGATGVGTCTHCDPSCATCDGSSSQQCLTCPDGSFLINNNTCVTSCNSPFFVTTNGGNDFCETPCSDSLNSSAFESGYCRPNCGDSLYRSATLVTLNACYCDYYEYWNSSCLATCDFPLRNSRTQGTRKFCDYPCAQNQYLFMDGSCLDSCDFPLIWQNISNNNYCVSKGCTEMAIKYVKATTQGHEYKLQFTPSSCDFEAGDLQFLLNTNEVAHELLGDFFFTVSKIQPALFTLDLALSQSVLQDTNLQLGLAGLAANLTVFQKFKPTALAETLREMAKSAQTAITLATGVTIISAIVIQATTSVWGFVGFQQLINYLKYINIQYPFQMEMLFVLGGATKFSSAMPNALDAATQDAYDAFQANEDLVESQEPPRKFRDYDETSYFIKNGGSLILLNMIFLVIITVIAQLRRIQKVRENKIFGLIDENLRWNFLLRTFLSTSTPLCVAICLQFRTISFQDDYLTISGVLTILSSLYFASFCIVILRILYMLHPEDFQQKERQDVYGTLVKGLDIKTNYTKYYYMFALARGVVISLLIVFAQSEPLLQILLLFFVNVSFVIYIFKKVPFSNIKERRKTLITECLITVQEILIALLTAKKKSESYYEAIGWIIVCVVVVIFINELVFIVSIQITAVREAIKFIKEKLKKKSDTKVEEKARGSIVAGSPVAETQKITIDEKSIIDDIFPQSGQQTPENITRRPLTSEPKSFSRRDRLYQSSESPLLPSKKRPFSSLNTRSIPGDKPPLIEDISAKDIEEFITTREIPISKTMAPLNKNRKVHPEPKKTT